MTKKVTVSLPDDVAERLAREKNASAFVAESIRRRMEAEHTREILTQLGFDLSEESMAESRARYDAAVAKITPELAARTAELLAEARRGPAAA